MYGIWLRARNSRRRRESGESRDPISLIPAPSPTRSARLAMKALRIMSLMALSSETSCQMRGSGISITSPASRITPVR